ncbi:hypothetical protein [Ensifer adhaerens]|uniref:hypothetical protein n=1 Tax=Ensifer adhaerens TaxID=106592 RepID=UPI000DC5896C|nr:hypothetical protein [Ensifer adhaerens]RAS13532.1 DnaA-like protein [Ensifer adhaerens]
MHHDSQLAKQAQHYSAVRARLWGAVPAVVKKVPSLTVVRPELIVKPAPAPEGRPRKIKPREEPMDHIYAFWVYRLQHKGWRTATEHAKMICFAARVPWEVFIGKTRSEYLTKLRERIAWELRQRNLSFPQIGLVINREHTSVLHSVRKYEMKMGKRAAAKWVQRKRRQADESRERCKAERERDAA